MVVAPGEVVGLIGPGLGQEHAAEMPGRGDRAERRQDGAGRRHHLRRRLEDPDLRALRRDSIGFVFQAPT